jgi:hypothetical protein
MACEMTEKEYTQGWYTEKGEDYLTHEALQKEVKRKFGLTKLQLAKIMLSTHYGHENEGEVRVATRRNGYNGKRFVITCLVDVEKLIVDTSSAEANLLP